MAQVYLSRQKQGGNISKLPKSEYKAGSAENAENREAKLPLKKANQLAIDLELITI